MGKEIGDLIIDIYAWIFWVMVGICMILLISAAKYGLIVLLN